MSNQNAELARLESEIGRFAATQPSPVLLAIVRALVEVACGAQGAGFRVHNKIKFYSSVLALLHSKGIS